GSHRFRGSEVRPYVRRRILHARHWQDGDVIRARIQSDSRSYRHADSANSTQLRFALPRLAQAGLGRDKYKPAHPRDSARAESSRRVRDGAAAIGPWSNSDIWDSDNPILRPM